MKFRDYFSLKHILFAVFIIGLMLIFAFCQSADMVKVSLESESIYIYSSKYTMNVEYAQIDSLELTDLLDPGEKVEDGYDDDLVRYGTWRNDAWGEYCVCADPDTSKCVVLHLKDGRTFVFSRKDDSETTRIYEELLAAIETN